MAEVYDNIKFNSSSEDLDNFINQQEKVGKDRIKKIKFNVHKGILENINPNEINKRNTLILTTGSDGRFENTENASGVEAVLYLYNSNHIPNSLHTVLNDGLEEFNAKSVSPKLFGTRKAIIEKKSNDNTIDSEYSENNVFFPTRFLDSQKLYGSNAMYENLKSNYFKNITGVGGSSRRSRKSRTNYHKRISKTGIGNRRKKELEHFNIDDGIISYGKENGSEFGVKHGPLRYMQYAMMRSIIKMTQDGKLSRSDLGNIHTFTKNKMNDIKYGLNKVDSTKFEELIRCYYYFLSIHHKCQSLLKDTNQNSIKIFLGSNQKNEFKEIISQFNESCSEIFKL